MAAPAKPTNNFTQDIQESSAILIVVKDRFLAIASGSHMIKCARILDAQRPGHAVDNKRDIDAILDPFSFSRTWSAARRAILRSIQDALWRVSSTFDDH